MEKETNQLPGGAIRHLQTLCIVGWQQILLMFTQSLQSNFDFRKYLAQYYTYYFHILCLSTVSILHVSTARVNLVSDKFMLRKNSQDTTICFEQTVKRLILPSQMSDTFYQTFTVKCTVQYSGICKLSFFPETLCKSR